MTVVHIDILVLLVLTGQQFCWAVKQSRVQAALTSSDFSWFLYRFCSTYWVMCCQCYSATKRKSNSHDLFTRTFLLHFAQVLNGVQNHWSFKLSDFHTCIRHIRI